MIRAVIILEYTSTYNFQLTSSKPDNYPYCFRFINHNILPFIAEVERYFVSDRATSALWNAALKCIGGITQEDTQSVVDKCKIVRGRAAYRALEQKKQKDKINSEGGLKCVGVDGKRDRKTKKIVMEVINGKSVEKKKVAAEEHITYTVEPPGDYLTHSVIPAGHGTR